MKPLRMKVFKTALMLAVLITMVVLIAHLLDLDDQIDSLDQGRPRYPSATKQANSLTCPLLSVNSGWKHEVFATSTRPLCSLPELTEEECSQIKAAFHTEPGENSCEGNGVEMCQIRHGRVECHNNECSADELISVGLLDPLTGQLYWKYYSFLQEVEESLNVYIQRRAEDYFPFCFLKCVEFWNPQAKSQFLVLPPRIMLGEAEPKNKSNENEDEHKLYNINIILLDSVSRPHFYRSLPKTIQVFKNINTKSPAQAHILDFELFHALRSRTFENLNALFSGEVIRFNETFSGLRPNPKPVSAQVMFGKFKKLGYQTLWQDDVCWLTSEWGIARELSVVNFNLTFEKRWAKLKNALNRHAIDQTGITHSACEVSKKYGVPQFFNNPQKVCYGGHIYHKYFLDHIEHFLSGIKVQASAKPLLSFTLLNIGHEGTGRRIQQLDNSLASFAQKLAQNPDTFSIILSDHGNSYGNFTRTVEGRFETFQPHLFLIIPDRIARLLGKERMDVLKQNQRRLISIQDLHYTVMFLLENERERSDNVGLFQPIAPNRTCEDLPLIPPYLCVCQGWESKVPRNSIHSLIAEFALGKLNELLQDYHTQTRKDRLKLAMSKSSYGSCEKLRGATFKNIRERRSNKSFVTSMDLYVQKDNIFNIEVQMVQGARVSLDMQLLSFTRLSEYGIYRPCANPGIPLNLCVCGLNGLTDAQRSHSAAGSQRTHSPLGGAVFGSNTTVDNLHENCLFLLLREYSSGVTFEVTNSCAFVLYNVELVLSLQNMQTSNRTPVKATVKPGASHFLVVVIQLDLTIPWTWQYTVNFSWKVLPVE